MQKAFADINRNILINILNEKISDKRFTDLINKMYNVNTLCPEGFWIKNNNGVMQGNILSPILCNIYLNKLDDYVIKEIKNKMEIGVRPKINPIYMSKIGLNAAEEKLPDHIKNKIKKSRRRHIQKLGIKRIIENEEFVRIKYVRYADDFIVGVRGSLELAKKIKNLIKNFLMGTLHLNMNDKKTKITNTYSDRAQFLGMYIYNMNAHDLPYRNSRMVENAKRTIRKNEVIRNSTNIKILKNTRERIVSSFNVKNRKELVIDAMKALGTHGKSRGTIRLLAEAIEKLKAEEENKTPISKEEIIAQLPKLEPTKIPINRVEIMNRIHKTLIKHNAISTGRA